MSRIVVNLRWLLLVAILAVPGWLEAQVGAAQAAEAGASHFSAILERFAAGLAEDVEQDGIGGITAAVMVGDTMVWSTAVGWADRKAGEPARAETIYRTGSVSKTFTAVILMLLVEQGIVGLDDPVVDHLPEFARLDAAPEEMRSITLRHLASHTGGLIREPRLPGAAEGPIEGWELKVIESLATTSLRTTPGAEYFYSNIGFGILGLALSRAAGAPFEQMVENWVFEPLGMRSSTFIVSDELESKLAVGYANRADGTVNTELPAVEHAGRGYKVPNGGIYSTVADLGQFMAALSGSAAPQILSSRSRERMLTVQTPGDPVRGYGLGLSLQTTESGTRQAGHGGSVAGYNAHMVFDPDSRIGVVLLRNYNRGNTNLGRAASLLLEELVRAHHSAQHD